MDEPDDADRAQRENRPGRADDATRRTHLANERTYLAWLRSGLTSLAVAIGVGKFLPDFVPGPTWPYATLGVGFALLGVVFCVMAIGRQLSVERSLREGRFAPMSGAAVVALGLYVISLAAATTVLVLSGTT